MNWDFFWDESMCMDNAYEEILGLIVGDVSRDMLDGEIFDAYAMLFGMSV